MNSKLNCQLISTADKVRERDRVWNDKYEDESIASDEAFTEALGEKLAAILNLKRNKAFPKTKRWWTTEGSKTSIGLARTLIRILEEASE